MRKLTIMVLLPLMAAVFAGCAGAGNDSGKNSDKPERQAKRVMGIRPQESYAPLSDYRLSLRTDGRRILHVGEGGEVTYALCNQDDKTIRIVEWFSNEPDNVLVYCQPWLTGMTAPDEEAWIPLAFEVPRRAIRYPLELMPGNQVLVTKKLPFVDKLAISPGAERRFFLRAKLNLTSVSVASPVSVLIVRPPLSAAAPAPSAATAPAAAPVKR